MNNLTGLSQENERVAVLPECAYSRDGERFNPNSDIWRINGTSDSEVFNFTKLGVSKDLLVSLKYVLCLELERLSVESVATEYSEFKSLIKFINESEGEPSEIEIEGVMAYRASLTGKAQPRMAALSMLLRRWYAYGASGVDDGVVEYLEIIRIPGGKKGVAVSTMDPNEGPLTDIEFQGVIKKLREQFKNESMSLRDYVLCMLYLCFGQRTCQYILLKVKDLVVIEGYPKKYFLKIPSAKKKGRKQREIFKLRALDQRLGVALVELTELVAKEFSGLGVDPQELPIFPKMSRLGRGPSGYSLHPFSPDLNAWLVNALSKLEVISERTGKPLQHSPYRYRRSFGTRLAMEGHGELVIAELLDHSDLQNVGVYVGVIPKIVERIDRAIAFRLAPMAKAFAGEVIRKNSTKSIPIEEEIDISAPSMTKDFQPVGKCGERGDCNLLAPIACYTCLSFRPWSDAPHLKILDWLIADRERLVKSGDMRIASIHDRTILAVAEVVRLCEIDSHGKLARE